jgi:hypothetical protein
LKEGDYMVEHKEDVEIDNNDYEKYLDHLTSEKGQELIDGYKKSEKKSE